MHTGNTNTGQPPTPIEAARDRVLTAAVAYATTPLDTFHTLDALETELHEASSAYLDLIERGES